MFLMWMLAAQCDAGDVLDEGGTSTTDDLTMCGVVGCVIARADRFFDLLARVDQEDDEELIHDTRVASRRLNEGLAVLKPMLEAKELSPLRSWLKEVRGLLGPVRDADVMGGVLTELLGAGGKGDTDIPPVATGFLKELACVRGKSLAEARRQLSMVQVLVHRDDMTRMLSVLVETMRSIARDEGIFNHEVQSELDQRVLRRVRRNRRTFRSKAKKAAKSKKVSGLHEARIAGKKARYALELAHEAHVLEGKRELKWMRRVQNRLGDINDLSVLQERIQSYIETVDGDQDAGAVLDAVASRQKHLIKDFAKGASKTLRQLKRVKAKRVG